LFLSDEISKNATIVVLKNVNTILLKAQLTFISLILLHLQLCLHSGPDIDPDNRDVVDDKWVIDGLSGFVAKHFPNLVPEPSIKETCIYTVSNEHIHFIFNYSYCVKLIG
jgi:hypothetical protein